MERLRPGDVALLDIESGSTPMHVATVEVFDPGPDGFDYARHRREINLAKNYVRLNEWPEWFTVDENTLYRVTADKGAPLVRLGSELIEGLELSGSTGLVVEKLAPEVR